jgi:ankyrin repeat protein
VKLHIPFFYEYIVMATRKHRKSRKSTKRFRRSRSKRQRGGGHIHEAAKLGNFSVVKRLLNHIGVDGENMVDNKDEFGRTVLMYAAEVGGADSLDTVRYLVEKRRANVHATDNSGKTALKYARSNVDVSDYLTKHLRKYADVQTKVFEIDMRIANVNKKDKDGATALMWAAQEGHLDIVRHLAAERYADVNAVDNTNSTALIMAAWKGHIDIVRYLVEERNADVNVKDIIGRTALMLAARYGHIDIVRYLVEERNADVNAARNDGETALMMAARKGHIDIVRYLAVERHADVNVKDNSGKTALMHAVHNGHEDIAFILQSGGKRKTRKSKKSKKSKKTRSSRKRGGAPGDKKKEQSYKVLKQLIDDNKISQSNQQDLNQMFFNYCKHGTLSAVIELLLAKAIDVNMVDDAGNTPLIVASDFGHTKIVKLLLNNDADPNIENKNGWTAVDFAVGFLMEEGLDYKHILGTDLFIALTNAGGLPGTAFHDMYKSPSSQTRSDTGAKIHTPTAPGRDDV